MVLDLGREFFPGDNLPPGDGGYGIITVLASIRMPEDIAGWPVRTEQGVLMDSPAWGKLAHQLDERGWTPVIFFDELRTLPPAKQAPLLRVINERVTGERKLPDSVRFVAAANAIEDAAMGNPLEPPMANRLAHLHVSVDTEAWVEGMSANTFRPRNSFVDVRKLGEQRLFIASFIRRSPSHLFAMPQEEDRRDGPWPSPRTWDLLAHVLATDTSAIDEAAAALVGLEAAAAFVDWRKSLKLPDPKDIFEDVKKYSKTLAELPDDQLYTALGSCWQMLQDNFDDLELPYWELLSLVARQKSADICFAFVQRLIRMRVANGGFRKPNVQFLEPFIDLLKRAGFQL
jgi:hypothetical protein